MTIIPKRKILKIIPINIGPCLKHNSEQRIQFEDRGHLRNLCYRLHVLWWNLYWIKCKFRCIWRRRRQGESSLDAKEGKRHLVPRQDFIWNWGLNSAAVVRTQKGLLLRESFWAYQVHEDKKSHGVSGYWLPGKTVYDRCESIHQQNGRWSKSTWTLDITWESCGFLQVSWALSIYVLIFRTSSRGIFFNNNSQNDK